MSVQAAQSQCLRVCEFVGCACARAFDDPFVMEIRLNQSQL